VIAIALALVGNASATITFTGTGTGSVDRADVQAAFGWNNVQFKRNVSGVSFTYAAGPSSIEGESCNRLVNWEGVEHFSHSRQAYEATYVNTAEVQLAHRKVTGFTLTGRGQSTGPWAEPWTGDVFPPECYAGPWLDDSGTGWTTEWISDFNEPSELYVNFGDKRVFLALANPWYPW